jgi:hypothetical protein
LVLVGVLVLVLVLLVHLARQMSLKNKVTR